MPAPLIRLATVDDVGWIGELLAACMTELFAKPWTGTPARLAADLEAGRVAIAVADRAGFE